MTSPIKFEVEVTQIIEHSSDIFSFEFQYVGQRIRFKPGQFVHLSLDEFDYSKHWPESRPYSIASAPSALNSFCITISRQGPFTNRILSELHCGKKIWMKGPYGDFVVQPVNVTDTVVFIAGGTGITPFCSFFDEIALSKVFFSSPVVLCYGAKNKNLLIYQELINKARMYMPNFRDFYFVEDREGPEDRYLHGRINIKYIVNNLSNPCSSTFYLSGPREMIAVFKSYLINEANLPIERIFLDEWV